MARRRGARDAQATVEMAAVCPVLIVLALVSYNVMRFTSLVARFDRVAPDIVLAHGAAPAGEGRSDASEEIASRLSEAMGEGVAVEVERVADGAAGDSVPALIGSADTYRCRMAYRPWPGDFSLAGVRFGAPLELVHERETTVDPWRPGAVV